MERNLSVVNSVYPTVGPYTYLQANRGVLMAKAKVEVALANYIGGVLSRQGCKKQE
jgi:hypothetical protein